jgi:hypothetical protein
MQGDDPMPTRRQRERFDAAVAPLTRRYEDKEILYAEYRRQREALWQEHCVSAREKAVQAAFVEADRASNEEKEGYSARMRRRIHARAQVEGRYVIVHYAPDGARPVCGQGGTRLKTSRERAEATCIRCLARKL